MGDSLRRGEGSAARLGRGLSCLSRGPSGLGGVLGGSAVVLGGSAADKGVGCSPRPAVAGEL